MAERTVAVSLVAKISGYKAGLQTAAASTKEFAGELDGMRKNSKAHFDELSKGAAIGGAALMGLVGWATKVGMEFDKQMSEVSAITNASAADMGKLRDAALEAGKATVFSATDAAKAEAELAKAGLSTSEILGGALTGALALAAAGSLDLTQAAEIAAKTMGQFELKGRDVGHIADVLAGAANASATDVHDLGEALKMGGGAAHAAGMSLDDTTTILTAFAKKALVGSDAGTSLKTMLMMLQAPTNKAQGVMDAYGFSVYDATGKMVDAYALTQKLKDSFGGLTQEERNTAFATIFGADAMRAANALYSLGSDGLHKLNKDMLDQADAARVAGQKTDNLSGDLEKLRGSLETLMITAQSGSTGPLRWIVEALDHMVGKFSDLPTGVQQAVFVLAGLTGGALLAVVAFVKVKTAVGDALDNLRAAGPASAKFADGLGIASKAAAKATVVLAALAAATAIADAFDQSAIDAQGLTDSLTRLGKTGDKTGELTRQFGDDLGGLKSAFNSLDNPFANTLIGVESLIPGLKQLDDQWLFGSPTKYAEQVKQVDDTLAGMVRSGNVEGARAAFVRVMQAANMTADEAEAKMPKYINATREAEKVTTEAATAAEAQATAAHRAEEANRKLAGAFGVAATAVDGLINKFKELNGGELSWRDAQRGAEAALDDLQAKLKDSHNSLDIHNEKGRAAAAAIDKMAEAAATAAQKKMDETHSVTEANKVYQSYIDQLRATLKQAGLTKQQIDELIGSIAQMPSSKVVTIAVDVLMRTQGLDSVLSNTMKRLQRAGMGMADGGVLSFAGGGTYENHTAQIAPAGAMRMWAEPETGGEAYIPLSAAKRGRSVATLADVDRRFGYPLSGGGGGATNVNVMVSAAPGADRVMAAITDALRVTVDTQFAGSAQNALSRRRR